MSSEEIIKKAHSISNEEMEQYRKKEYRLVSWFEADKPTPNELPNRRNISKLVK